MSELQAVLKREVSPDRLVGDLVEGAVRDVASVLGSVVARSRAVTFGDEVKRQLAELDQAVKALAKEREALRPQVVKLDDQVIRARGDLEIARRQKNRALAGLGGEVPDVAEVEDQVRDLEREATDARTRLRTVTSKGREAERDKALLASLLARLEGLPVPDGDLLAVLRTGLAGEH